MRYLVPLLFEEKQLRGGPQKKGNKVSTILTKKGVQFRDITRLLAPSTNLRKFGQLFGLEQVKAHFPFGCLTSVSFLSQPRLPSDWQLWKSELSSSDGDSDEPRLRQIIDEAQVLFEKANCRSVGDYLLAYLYLDVDILYRASQEWRKTLVSTVGLDFVESNRYTISGLSYTAGLKKLEMDRRVGSFFPNNSQMYRLLRLGMRGNCLQFSNKINSSSSSSSKKTNRSTLFRWSVHGAAHPSRSMSKIWNSASPTSVSGD